MAGRGRVAFVKTQAAVRLCWALLIFSVVYFSGLQKNSENINHNQGPGLDNLDLKVVSCNYEGPRVVLNNRR